jgi:hypothetical protein
MAPVTSPRPFFSGRIFTTTVTREPSGRPMITSASRTSDVRPASTSAMGHWSCGMKLPSSVRNILNEPQNRSSTSSSAGSRPHNAAAWRLNFWITPEASQE